MSTSLLYHALNIVGYRYRSTEYVGKEIIFTIERVPRFPVRHVVSKIG
jgi:hypothetical protein